MSKCNTVKTVSVLSGSSLVIRTKAVKKITHVSNDFFFFFLKSPLIITALTNGMLNISNPNSVEQH